MSEGTSEAELRLQVLALSRVERCRRCARLGSLTAVARGQLVARPEPALADCAHRHCQPLVRSLWPERPGHPLRSAS